MAGGDGEYGTSTIAQYQDPRAGLGGVQRGSPEQLEAWSKACPLQRNGEPIHIAQAIKFIMENNFLHGETIDVNGGLFMR